MDPIGALVGLSEISLGLAGFASIVLVLGTRANRLNSEVLGFIRIMVSNAIGTALGCLLCVGILALEISTPFVWTVLSGGVLIATVAVSALNFFLFLRQHPDRSSGRALFWWSFVAVSCVVQLINAFGLFASPSFGLFFIGLVILFSQAGLQFVYLVYALLEGSAA